MARIKVFDNNTQTWVYADKSFGKDGKTPVKGVDYFDGKDGVDGYTPVRGVDYYTDADKVEFESYIATELAKRGQLKPEFANSIEECTDTTKLYVLPDGFIYAYMLTEKEVSTGGGYTNLIDGVDGYIKEGKRYSASSQAWKDWTDPNAATIVVPVPTSGEVNVRVRGVKYTGAYPDVYGGQTNTAFTNCFNYTVTLKNTYDDNGDLFLTFSNTAGAKYIIMHIELTTDVTNVIATVNEEIAEGGTTTVTEEAWVSTGLAFVPADYEDRIVELEKDVSLLKNMSGTNQGGENNTPTYTNVLPLAINADGTPYVGTNGEKGYKTGWRLNSSRVEKEAEGRCCTGFIPVKYTDTVRFKNIKSPLNGNINGYVHFYGSDFTSNTGMAFEPVGRDGSEWSFVPCEVQTNWPSYASANINATDKTAYMRISTGIIDDTSIITINEEVVDTNGDTTDESNVTSIKDWDAPIYDANIPVFELSAEKAAMTNATNTPNSIYAKYDALMAKHPRYITKTDLGLCSDGVNHVYRYDFREPEPLHESDKVWSETKAKAVIVTGIHFEWAGIYAMYNALEEIADNPELRHFRRNTHLIVVPVANPYATIADNYQSGLSTPNSYGVRNANGVEIHRNFEVDWVLTEAGTTHYGGAEPLSEMETRYIDNILKENTDAAFLLSCHNCGVDTFWGTGFIWASTATKYMCNMGYRVIDKLSDAWMEKYGDTLSAGIAEYKTDLVEDGETRLGWTGISTSPGTEAKQATKYGIQGTNVEICNPFQIHGTKASPEPSMSAFTMSRGAEVYVNFLLTAFGVYDPKDKKEYMSVSV